MTIPQEKIQLGISIWSGQAKQDITQHHNLKWLFKLSSSFSLYIHSGNVKTDARSVNVNEETPATVYCNEGAEDGKYESLVRFHKWHKQDAH